MSENTDLVIIGSGKGGVEVLGKIFNGTPSLDTSIIIIQRMKSIHNKSLRRWLDELTEMEVKIAEPNIELNSGSILIAPTQKQLELSDNRYIRLEEKDSKNNGRHSMDRTMRSVKKEEDQTVVGILLSGLFQDGVEGIRHISGIGGKTIVQNFSSALTSNKIRKALSMNEVDLICNPMSIREELIDLFDRRSNRIYFQPNIQKIK